MKLVLSIVAILVLAFPATAQAAVVIDPGLGWIGEFYWQDGLGSIDGVYATGGDEGLWSITVSEDSYLSLAMAKDIFGTPAGDSFEFILDGAAYAWDAIFANQDPEIELNYFQGEAYDIFLTAGTHILSFNVISLATEGATTYDAGYGFASFSAVLPAAHTPLPAAFWLFGSALLPVLLCRKIRPS